jgi:CPA1 family monovalent cation:H+ antiporter
MYTETILIVLFSVAMTVAIIIRLLHMPYTVALVLAGLVLGMLHTFSPPRLTIASLAMPGVAAAIALTVLVLTPVVKKLLLVQDFTWHHALVFGALISATDPIAVVTVFKSLGVPKRLSVLLNGESLLNDGTAIVFFTLSLALVTGSAITAGRLAVDFVTIVGFGALIGVAVGLAASQLLKQIDDPMIEITLSIFIILVSLLPSPPE